MKKLSPERTFAAAKKGSVLELFVYDIIGKGWFEDGVTASGVAAEIKAAGEFSSISVRINSPGGNAFEGIAISNLLRAQGKPVAVAVDGVAASAASIIAMAGDTIAMGQGAMMMIHNASTFAAGQASDLRAIADTLDKVSSSIAAAYVAKTGKTIDQIQALMDAETWLSAEDSVKEGFATEVISRTSEERAEALALAASFDMKFKNAPKFEAENTEEITEKSGSQPEPVDWQARLAVRRKQLELVGA